MKTVKPDTFRPNRLLVAVDFSSGSENALESAFDFVGERPVDLHLVHVRVLFDSSETLEGDDDDIRLQLESLYQRVTVKRVVDDSTKVTFTVLRDIAPAAAILRYAAECDAELIISGTHGRRGFRRMILGSVAEEIVRLSSCPVLTIGGIAAHHLGSNMRSILVPIDFSSESLRTVRVAKELGAATGSTVDILHVVEEAMHPAFYNTGVFSVYDMRPDLDRKALKEMERLYESAKGPAVESTFVLRQGHAAKEIVQYASSQRSDVIVMSTHGLTGLSHVLIGSVAESVVRTAPCPVLILPRQHEDDLRERRNLTDEVAA